MKKNKFKIDQIKIGIAIRGHQALNNEFIESLYEYEKKYII